MTITRFVKRKYAIDVDAAYIESVERGITPPLGKAVTLPLRVGDDRRFVVYLATSGFDLDQPTDEEIVDLANALADRMADSELRAEKPR